MGKKDDDPPPPPDPKVVAGAQTGTNINTALANTALAQLGQITPYGSLRYDKTGTYDFTDPTSGTTYTLPQYTAITELSESGKRQFDQQNQISESIMSALQRQVGQIDAHISAGPNLKTPQYQDRSGFGTPTYGASLDAPTYGSSLNAPTYGASLNAPSYQRNDSSAPRLTAGSAIPNNTQVPINSYSKPPPPGQTQQAMLPTSTGATSGIPTNFSGPVTLPGLSQRADAPQLSGKTALPTNLSGRVAAPQLSGAIAAPSNLSKAQAAPDLISSYVPGAGDTGATFDPNAFSKDRDAVTEALMSRMRPDLDRRRQDFEQNLSDRGVKMGTGEWDEQITRFGREQTDANMQALLAGSQEQSRLLGEARSGAAFANDANLTKYGLTEDRARYGDDQQWQRAAFDTDQARYRDSNAWRGAEFNTDQNRYQDDQAWQRFAAQQSENRNADANAWQRAQFQEDQGRYTDSANLQRGGFQATQNQYADDLQKWGYGARQDENRYLQDDAWKRFAAQNQQAQYTDQFNQQGYNDRYQQARDQDAFMWQQYGANRDQEVANYEMDENRRRYDNQNQFALRDLEDRQRAENNALSGQQFADQQAIQGRSDTLANQGFANQQAIQARNDALTGQQFANQQAIQARSDALAGDNWNRQMSLADAMDQRARNELQDQITQYITPINAFNGLFSEQQVNIPQFNTAGSAQIPTTDYAGLVNQNYADQLGIYGKKMDARSGFLGNLSQLGAAAIIASDVRLKADIDPIGERNGHNVYAYRYLTDAPNAPLRVGVLAQEVMQTRPDAVSMRDDGMLQVSYGALGLRHLIALRGDGVRGTI